jgi:hypothetical protein
VTSENLELVRSIYAAWERGDFSETAWAHPEIEFLSVGDTPTRGHWKGLAGMAEGWRGKTSGLEVGQMWTKGASGFDIDATKVTRLTVYTDHERSLADLGPPERT